MEYGSIVFGVAELEGKDRKTFEGQELSIERLKSHFVGSLFFCVSGLWMRVNHQICVT